MSVLTRHSDVLEVEMWKSPPCVARLDIRRKQGLRLWMRRRARLGTGDIFTRASRLSTANTMQYYIVRSIFAWV